MNRLAQLRMILTQTREVDPRIVPYMALAGLLGFALPFVLLGVLNGRWIIGTIVGVITALLAGLVVFGRRAQSAQLAAIEGQPGAALAVVNSMRGLWFATPAVAITRKQDMVHRVVGPPGVVLVGEGATARVNQLLKQEETRLKRSAGDVPVHTVHIGDGENQVSLKKLRMHLMKLPRSLKKPAVRDLEKKLNALGSGKIPMPKGPIPGGGSKKLR